MTDESMMICAYGFVCIAPLSAFDSCALTTSGHFPKKKKRKKYKCEEAKYTIELPKK